MVTESQVRLALEEVMDPEIPIISVVDLGIITRVEISSKEKITIKMTPTFTGCPAIDLMKELIRQRVANLGFNEITVEIDRTVTWNSNMISVWGKQKLENFGLGTPVKHDGEITPEMVSFASCPKCKSENTSLRSPFGSALCRSIHFCFDCKESFERFKPL